MYPVYSVSDLSACSNGAVAPKVLSLEEQAEAAEKEKKEAEAQAYREMFERVWAANREEQDRKAAAWARDYPPTPVPAD